METTLKLTKQQALKLYPNAASDFKEILETSFTKDFFNQKITDRVKTFEDALEILGEQPDNVKTLLAYNGQNADMIAAQAHLKLSLIARALNEGWKPDWTNSSEYKCYPWFDMRSGSGLSFDGYAIWYSHSIVGSRLCYKSRELAEYAGKQFISLYTDLFILK